jgi:hypothetical protein
MKKVFLFLASALVCAMTMISCSKEDGAPALTNIRVEPSTVTKPVGESQQVTVTKIPVDADEPVYTWTTSDASIATVSNSGLVTITGIGSTTVTVTSGNISATVAVTGTVKGVSVKDEQGSSVGTYPFDDSSADITFSLTATVDPPNAGIKPEWSVDVSSVKVAPSADGLSAQVTITAPGAAIITVSVGTVTATYTITTSSILESAVGYWTFDDPDNLTKATKGNDLVFHYFTERDNGPIISASGPTADNKAAFVPVGAWIECLHNIAPNGSDAAKRVNEFTFMFDVMAPTTSYHTLIHAALEDMNSSLYLKSSGRVAISDTQFGDRNTANNAYAENVWYRFVFSVNFDVENSYYNYYMNGAPLVSTHQEGNTFKENVLDYWRHTLDPQGVWLFYDHPEQNGSVDDNDIYVAAIAVWDHPLTAAEVAALGMYAVDE